MAFDGGTRNGAPPGRREALVRPPRERARGLLRDRSCDLVRDLVRDRRGALTSEYTILVGVVGLVFVFALVAVGPKLVRHFMSTRTLLASPFP